MYKGYDISVIQGVLDFGAISASGVSFVICRCGVGNSNIDTNYAKNIVAGSAAGLKMACYNFAYPLPTIPSQPMRDPKAQAQYHSKSAGNVDVHCLDLEWPYPQNWAQWQCNAQQIQDWTFSYLEEYEQLTGKVCALYSYPSFLQAIKFSSEITKYPLWIASYTSTPVIPAPWSDWAMWQNSGGSFHLPSGVAIDTDLAKDLSLWSVSDVPAPTPSPPPEVAPTPDPVAANPIPVPAPDPTPPPVVSPPANPNNNVVNFVVNLITGIFRGLFSR